MPVKRRDRWDHRPGSDGPEPSVLNLEDQGFSVAVWNLEREWTDAFLEREGRGRRIIGTKSFRDVRA